MRKLTDEQWERYEALVAQLASLAPSQRAATLHAWRAQQVETPDVLSLVALHFALPPEPDRWRRGERIGHCTLGEPLAYGGMGVVYQATQDIGRDVALKLIHPAFLAMESQNAVARFQQEMTLLAKLEHPHIARIYDGGMYQDPLTGDVCPFFVMQLVRGGVPLTTYVTHHGLALQERLTLFLRVCEAIEYAHTLGIIHRDLKPANLLVDAEGWPFVVDFGLAQISAPERRLTGPTQVSGTPAYLSPEQVSAGLGPIGPGSDVYALGVILYELLAAHRPYEVPPYASVTTLCHAIVDAAPIPLGQRQPAYRGVLETIVAMALAKRPEDRYPSVAALHSALAHYLHATHPPRLRDAPRVGPWYLADHRLVVCLDQGPTEHAVLTVTTQVPALAAATLRFTIGDEIGAVRLHPSPTATATWGATHVLGQAFRSIVGLTPTFHLDLPQPEQRLVTALLITWSAGMPTGDAAPVTTASVPLIEERQVLQETILRHDGYVLRGVLEGEFLALFGVPQVDEHAASRALQAALELRHVGTGLRGPLRMGLATGQVYFDPRNETVHAIELSHLVHQVHAQAAPGEIRVEAHTYAATRRMFQFHTAEKPEARVSSYTVLAPLFSASTSPMVGREAEWAVMQGYVEQVCAGTGHLLTLLGEAGIGKSRLVTAMRQQWSPRVRWFESQTLSPGHRLSYGPFRDLIRQAAGLSAVEDASQAQAQLLRRLQALLPEDWEERAPYLLRLAGIPGRRHDEERLQSLPLEALGHQIFRTAWQFFMRLAEEAPVVLVIENWHWRDPASAALLAHLVPLLQRVPLLICLVSRPDHTADHAPWREAAAEQCSDLHVPPLSPAASAQLLDILTPHSTVAPSVRRTLLEQAGGNPFFLEELVYALVPSQGMTLAGSIPLPASLAAQILARFHELPETHKQVLRLAAVLGHHFTVAMLQELTQRPVLGLLQELEALQHLHFVERSPVGEHSYQFHHDLIQETVYQSLWPETRRAIHQQVAQYLESLDGTHGERHAAQLAYHYAHAEDWENARDSLLHAGEQACQVAADADALLLYQQVLTLCGERLDPFSWISVQRKMGEALYRRGDYERAETLLLQALGKSGRAFPTSRWGVGRALIRHLLQHAGRRLLPHQLLPQVTDSDRCRIAAEHLRIHACLGWIHFYTGRRLHQLLGILVGLNMAERHGHASDIALGLAALGITADLMARDHLAAYYYRCAALWTDHKDPSLAEGFVTFCRGYHAERLGQCERALAYLQRAADTYWQAGEMRSWGAAMIDWVCLAYHQGHFERAFEVSKRIAALGEEGADKQMWGWGLASMGRYLEMQGEWQQAEVSLHQALTLLREVPDYFSVVWASGVLGQLYVRCGQMEQARAVLEAARQLSAARGVRGIQLLEVRKGLVEVCLPMAEEAMGQAQQVALQHTKQACRALWRACRYYATGRPHAYRAQGTYMWCKGNPAAARKWWQRSLQEAEAQGACWDLGRTHYEIGRRLGDAASLAQAITIFTDLGATVDAANAQQALQGSRGYGWDQYV